MIGAFFLLSLFDGLFIILLLLCCYRQTDCLLSSPPQNDDNESEDKKQPESLKELSSTLDIYGDDNDEDVFDVTPSSLSDSATTTTINTTIKTTSIEIASSENVVFDIFLPGATVPYTFSFNKVCFYLFLFTVL